MPSTQRKAATASGTATRVQNVTGDQTVKATGAMLARIVVANAAASVGTLTLKDGATIKFVLQVPASTSIFLDFGMFFTTSLIVNPSAATLDCLILFD